MARLARKLVALMADVPQRRALSDRGRAHAARFSWRQAALTNWDEVLRITANRPLAAASQRPESPG